MSEETQSGVIQPSKPFNFVVVFWGLVHREFFLRLCAPSCRSPNNIPSLQNREKSKFLICTLEKDWKEIQSDPDFIALKNDIKVEWLPLDSKVIARNKYNAMSWGHRLATEVTFNDRACGVYLTPDLVLADGAVKTLERYSEQGKSVVLSVAIRFNQEGLVEDLANQRSSFGEPLVLENRWLANLALKNLHIEAARYDWDSGLFAEMPHNIFWRLPKNKGLVIFGFSWAPLLFDYTALKSHDITTFDSWTMDGDYVFRNFGISEDIKVVTSTDDLLLVSFTPKKERPGNISELTLKPRWFKTFPLISKFWKISRIRWMLNSGNVDPLKRKNLTVPVFFKTCDMPDSDWKKVTLNGLSVIKYALSPKGCLETLSVKIIDYVNQNTSWPFRLFNPVQTMGPPNIGSKIVNSSGVGSHETRVITPLLTLGKWYWEIHSPNLGALSGALLHTATFGFVKAGVSSAALLGNVKGSWGWQAGHSQDIGERSLPLLIFFEDLYVVRVAVDITTGDAWVGFENNFTSTDVNIAPTFERLPAKIYGALTSTHGDTGTAEILIRTKKDECLFSPPEGFSHIADWGSSN